MEDFEKADSSAGNQLPLTISMEFWWYNLFEVFWDIFREMYVRDCILICCVDYGVYVKLTMTRFD
jgi:hypothetical protein